MHLNVILLVAVFIRDQNKIENKGRESKQEVISMSRKEVIFDTYTRIVSPKWGLGVN